MNFGVLLNKTISEWLGQNFPCYNKMNRNEARTVADQIVISHMAGVLVAAHLEEEKKCITAPPAGAHHVGRDLKRTTCEEDNM